MASSPARSVFSSMPRAKSCTRLQLKHSLSASTCWNRLAAVALGHEQLTPSSCQPPAVAPGPKIARLGVRINEPAASDFKRAKELIQGRNGRALLACGRDTDWPRLARKSQPSMKLQRPTAACLSRPRRWTAMAKGRANRMRPISIPVPNHSCRGANPSIVIAASQRCGPLLLLIFGLSLLAISSLLGSSTIHRTVGVLV